VFEDVAFIPDVSGLDDRLTVRQTIDYIRGVNDRWNDERAQKLLEISNLPLKRRVGKLSKGMKTKLYLLITLSLDVDFLLLDEPTLGLDIAFRKEFFNTILGEFFDENKTILISTHQVEEVEDLLQEIIFIDEGRILLHEEVEAMKSRLRIVTLPFERAQEILNHNPRLVSKTLGSISAVLDSAIEIPDASYGRANLADIFLSCVGGSNESM
ncbi:MAG TPA: ABC transporter ATP-binding protein, partial [Candidatus Syntrophosphaera sp.]|nr:ABC transporter ATP-binding protein [Candidatus Syntrophosphaera sp.]